MNGIDSRLVELAELKTQQELKDNTPYRAQYYDSVPWSALFGKDVRLLLSRESANFVRRLSRFDETDESHEYGTPYGNNLSAHISKLVEGCERGKTWCNLR
jgi:hypothetical protein